MLSTYTETPKDWREAFIKEGRAVIAAKKCILLLFPCQMAHFICQFTSCSILGDQTESHYKIAIKKGVEKKKNYTKTTS